MSSFFLDTRLAFRSFASRPGFALAATLTLALGIGANVTIFSIVNAVLLRPPPFGDRSDRVVTLHGTHRLMPTDFSFGDTEISYPDLLDMRQARAFEGIGGYLTRSFTLSGEETTAERVRGGSVTTDLFPLLGIEPRLGRRFRAEEAAPPGLESVVMLTDGLWRRRYGADPQIIGRQIIINDRARTVVGVLPPGVKFPERDELYMPLRWDDVPRSARNVNGVAVLRDDVSMDQAQAEVDAIAARLASTYPDTNRGWGVQLMPFREVAVGQTIRLMAQAMMAAVGCVLLVVCANLANLMLVRGAGRRREIAIRAAMGASRARLVSIALAESAWLALAGTGFGLLASQWALDFLRTRWPEELPYWLRFDIDVRIALFTAGASAFTAIAIGLLPALRAARPDLVGDLKDASRGASLGISGQRVQKALAVAQVALCLALLVGANLMIRSFLSLQRADLGFDDAPLLTARAYLAGDAYDDVRARASFYVRVTETLSALPGAGASAVTTALPGDEGGWSTRLVVDGRTGERDETGAQGIGVTARMFDALGIGILEGRTFREEEVLDPEARVAVINRTLAQRLWGTERAIDRRLGLRSASGTIWLRVVGVVADVHYEQIGKETEQSRLSVYVPYAFDGARSLALIVRADNGRPEALIGPAREALSNLSAAFPIFRVMTMSDLRWRTAWQERFFGVLMGLFAGAAVLLACLGVYALVAYAVGRRSREIGVRVALGATPRDVIVMMLGESGRIAAAGVAAGTLLGVWLARGLSGTLYGVQADGWLFVTMLVPLVAALLLATWLPARRAARVEPTVALREE